MRTVMNGCSNVEQIMHMLALRMYVGTKVDYIRVLSACNVAYIPV
jgi:hypothetical protein